MDLLMNWGYKTYSVETPLENRHRAMALYEPPPGSIIYVCNPCNPTGDVWETDNYLQLCKKYPPSVLSLLMRHMLIFIDWRPRVIK